MTWSVEIDPTEFLKAFGTLKDDSLKAINRAMREAIKFGEGVAKSTTSYKDRTGFLRSHTGSLFNQGRYDVDPDGMLFADAPYAKYVNDGTKPHIIRPKRAQALRFVAFSGETVFAREVHHPGTKPRLFMNNARDAAERALLDGSEDYLQGAIDEYDRTG